MTVHQPILLSLENPPALRIGTGHSQRIQFERWANLVALQRHALPTAPQIEAQIEAIENWLMPLLAAIPPASRDLPLRVNAPEWLAALGADTSGSAHLTLAELEAVFNRVADIASGHPAREGDPPLDALSVARLVLLREVMHHGGFKAARVHP